MNILPQKTLLNSVVVNPVLTASGMSQKKDVSPVRLSEMQIKIFERCFLCISIVFVKPVTNVQQLPQICL